MAPRLVPFTQAEISRYQDDGFLAPIRVLNRGVARRLKKCVEDCLEGRNVRPCPTTTRMSAFHLGIWQWDKRFRSAGEEVVTELEPVATDPVIAGLARQLIGSTEVLLMEANPVIKQPDGIVLPWHQDYSYWPLGEPAAVTAWIALDDVGPENGSLRVVPGSHLWGERLPVSLGDAEVGSGGRTGPLGRSFFHAERPGLGEVAQDPEAEGKPVVPYALTAGECGFHHPLLWHSSTVNRTDSRRCALVLRYLAAGTIWLGAARSLYRDVGCADGDRVDGTHFPSIPAAF